MTMRAETALPPIPTSHFRNLLLPAMLAVFMLVSRILCRGPLYFGDGPAEIAALQRRFTSFSRRATGFSFGCRPFSDPVLAMTIMNILFSVAGVIVFYYAACLFASRLNAFLAALAYSTVFYLWFSGEIHSTYASQILFPIATFYALVRYERNEIRDDARNGARWLLWLAALLFAVGAGMRPTDGAFLIPLVLYFAIFRMPRKEGFLFLALIAVFSLGARSHVACVQERWPRCAGVRVLCRADDA